MNKKYMALDKYYKKKYGITWKQRMEMWRNQDGRCAICKRHERQFSKRLHVDHCHASGKSRSLLCYTCNKWRVGKLTTEWAYKVYQYLREHDEKNNMSIP